MAASNVERVSYCEFWHDGVHEFEDECPLCVADRIAFEEFLDEEFDSA